ncbi:MAG: recombinase family protein, partial [Oscillospiraceae bacterium]
MDIESGKINCVIVKDLSRLGREFVETGYYIEMYFPRHQVRFISINNRFDTLNGMSNITFGKLQQYQVPLANLMNEAFVADIRQKTQGSLDTCEQGGGYVAPRAPYGYRKNPDDCHKLLVDKE